MSVELQRTFCRICEAHCGLVAEVERSSRRVLRLILLGHGVEVGLAQGSDATS